MRVPVRGEPLLKLSLALSLLVGALVPLAGAARRGTLFCFGGRRRSTVTLSGTTTYTGRQPGVLVIVAARDAITWSDGPSTQSMLPGGYTMTAVPLCAQYWIRAFCDMNGNGQHEAWEAHGERPLNPLALPGTTTALDIALTDPDTDADTLPDWWELRFWGDLAPLPGDDLDGDTRSNLLEYTEGTDPTISDLPDDDNHLNLTVYTPLSP